MSRRNSGVARDRNYRLRLNIGVKPEITYEDTRTGEKVIAQAGDNPHLRATALVRTQLVVGDVLLGRGFFEASETIQAPTDEIQTVIDTRYPTNNNLALLASVLPAHKQKTESRVRSTEQELRQVANHEITRRTRFGSVYSAIMAGCGVATAWVAVETSGNNKLFAIIPGTLAIFSVLGVTYNNSPSHVFSGPDTNYNHVPDAAISMYQGAVRGDQTLQTIIKGVEGLDYTPPDPARQGFAVSE